MEIDVNEDSWTVEYGQSRGRTVTLQIANNSPQSLRIGDDFTVHLILPTHASAGDTVSVKIKVTSID